MISKNRNRRIALICVFGTLLILGLFLIMTALNRNLQFYYHPSEVLAPGFEPESETYKVGGVVVPGTLKTLRDLTIQFSIVDFVEAGTSFENNASEILVAYKGVLPDLFAENEITVVTGKMTKNNQFTAGEVLAKHDENYKPVEMD